MENIHIKDFISAINGQCEDRYLNHTITTISKDTRTIQKGDLYMAIVGENFDGHQFINSAIEKGAGALLVSKPVSVDAAIPVITVKDTVLALQQLATYYIEKRNIPVIAITGSVGKTSTKDMVYTVLSSKFNVHKSSGNYNNEIGMPLSVLDLKECHNAIVLEMGMSDLGEISVLTNIAKPSIAAITNIGISHIENLGSRENILKAKLEIIEGLSPTGTLILNANDPYLASADLDIPQKIVTVGIETDADYMAYNIVNNGENGMAFTIDLNNEPYTINMPAIGIHNVTNALYGIVCGIELGLTSQEIVNSFKAYKTEKLRLNIVEKDGIKFINDAYNASPDSMEAGLKVLKSISGNHRSIAILGNMFELGNMAASAHKQVGEVCHKLAIDFTAIIGDNASDMASGLSPDQHYKIFENHQAIVTFMKDYLKPEDVVLLKGSRGMAMEQILELW